MLRMILADDEPVITRGIQILVDWEQLGVRIIGVYDNGQKALHGILTQRPDIAVLDISMPGKNGIEILKELAGADCPTRVVFLSGFQDFHYAQAALHYGARDYLLKPVKKESLVYAVRKCVSITKGNLHESCEIPIAQDGFLPAQAYQRLAEAECPCYTLCAAELFGLDERSDIERQLILFSALGRLEVYLEQRKAGAAFQKEGRLWLALRGKSGGEAKSFLEELRLVLYPGCDLGFAVGDSVPQISLLKEKAPQCLDMLGYFYYLDYLSDRVLVEGGQILARAYSPEELKKLRDRIVTALFEQNREQMRALVKQYLYAACSISGSKSDTAVYYLLSCIRAVEERFEMLDAPLGSSLIVQTMDKARLTTRYSQMEQIFSGVLENLFGKAALVMQCGDKKDMLKAKGYIEEHYAENLTLGVLAGHIHMNPFYFSSLFKKQTGQNFKDYLNKTRMKHGMELLVLSDKKIYEIAEEVGFKDYRHFNELFHRYYGKTPTAYRKELLEVRKRENKNKD